MPKPPLSCEPTSARSETRRKLPYLLNFSAVRWTIFDSKIQDARPQHTTHDVSVTTKSANKKKMTKGLHQTYAAIFLSLMSIFQAAQTAVQTSTL
jgi:hypothetical protein